jgi:hypothetical protein
VDWLGMMEMEVVSMNDSCRLVMRTGPNASAPTAPTIFTVMETG